MSQTKKAIQLLENPENYPMLLTRCRFDRKILLFCYPSFEPSTSWSLFKTDKNYFLRRVEWDGKKSLSSQNSEPFTVGCEVIFSTETAEEILLSLSLIEFCPFKQPELIGVDGTVCGITVGNDWLSCSLRWWYLPSDDWKSLVDWFGQTVSLFEQALPQSTCKNL